MVNSWNPPGIEPSSHHWMICFPAWHGSSPAGKLIWLAGTWTIFFESNVFPNWTTPWKFNIAPKNIPSQKESSLPTIIFQGRAVKLREGMGIFQPAMLVCYRVLGLGNPTCKTHVTPVASLTMLEIASLLSWTRLIGWLMRCKSQGPPKNDLKLETGSIILKYLCIHLEPKWPLFWLEFRPCFGGLTFKNSGHLGSMYIMWRYTFHRIKEAFFVEEYSEFQMPFFLGVTEFDII